MGQTHVRTKINKIKRIIGNIFIPSDTEKGREGSHMLWNNKGLYILELYKPLCTAVLLMGPGKPHHWFVI